MNIIEKYEQIKQEAISVKESSENIGSVSMIMNDVGIDDMKILSKHLNSEPIPSNGRILISTFFFWGEGNHSSIAIWSVLVAKKDSMDLPSVFDLYTTPPVIGDETKLS